MTLKKYFSLLSAVIITIGIWACSASTSSSSNGDSDDDDDSSCTLTADTTETSTENSYGCKILTRDTSECDDSRSAQGLSGFWTNFSCRVSLTKSGSSVVVSADSQPDYKSSYFSSSHACYESFSASGRSTNPNSIAEQSVEMTVPYSPTTSGGSSMDMGVVGVAANGVSIYSNEAAPGDDIYEEVATFDKCEGHPDNSSSYHYHIEPPAISNDDSAFIGVMRDGHPIYGVKDEDGSTPTLDAAGGHTGTTPDSPSTNVYHYHVHLQTSGSDSAYFITSGTYKGAKGACTGCN